MKGHYFISGIAILAGLFSVSCDDTSKLAHDVEGSWTGVPVPLSGGDMKSTMVNTFDFGPIQKGNSQGDIVISSAITTQTMFEGTADGVLPEMTITCSSTSSISGKWSVSSNTEIALDLDLNSLTIEVDPEAISVSSDFDGNISSDAVVEKLGPQIVNDLHNRLMGIMEPRCRAAKTLNNVTVKNGKTLTLEVGAFDYVLSRME